MAIVCTLLQWLFGLCLLVSLLSCAIAWYESANLDPSQMDTRFRPGKLLHSVWLIISEAIAMFITLLLHPLGWLPTGQTLQRRTERPPILLLHGLFHNRACWWWLQLRLRLAGWRDIYSLNLSAWHDIEILTEMIAKKIDSLRLETGATQVVLIGHSMGAVLARNYIQRRGGSSRVALAVLLGAPNHGSKLAPFAVSPLARHLLPESAFMRGLNEAAMPDGVEIINIISAQDNMVLPWSLGQLTGCEEHVLDWIGHNSLLYHPRALRPLFAALKRNAL